MFCLYTLPLARPAQAKIQMLTTSCRSLTLPIHRLTTLHTFKPIKIQRFSQHWQDVLSLDEMFAKGQNFCHAVVLWRETNYKMVVIFKVGLFTQSIRRLKVNISIKRIATTFQTFDQSQWSIAWLYCAFWLVEILENRCSSAPKKHTV